MQFVHLKRESIDGIEPRESRALDMLAGLIACVGARDFATTALAELNRGLPLCWWSMYSLSADAPPVYHGGGSFRVPDHSAEAFESYRNGLYLADHTFHAARESLRDGDIALTHWHAEEISPAHRGAIYTRHGLRERTSLVRLTRPGVLLALNVYRHVEQRGFKDAELQLLEALGKPLLSCVELHVNRFGDDPSPACTPAAAWAMRRSALPPREREVCERLLKGWTHAGIAADLGLSAATIKTYRDRAFERLGIHHRNELFALALGDAARH